jgi:hypothetical protein
LSEIRVEIGVFSKGSLQFDLYKTSSASTTSWKQL